VNNPLTDEERREWNDRAAHILKVGHVAPHDDYLIVTCRRARRYEDTLQVKDEQIAALVTALEDAPLGLERWARTNDNYERWFSVYAGWRQKRDAAIKEVKK